MSKIERDPSLTARPLQSSGDGPDAAGGRQPASLDSYERCAPRETVATTVQTAPPIPGRSRKPVAAQLTPRYELERLAAAIPLPALPAPSVPVETLYDETYPDPYRFFDRSHRKNAAAHALDDDTIVAWMQAQTRRTDRVLACGPGTNPEITERLRHLHSAMWPAPGEVRLMNGTATWTPDGMNHAVLADENGAEIVDSGLVLEAAGIEVAGFVHPPLASKDGRYLAFIADDGTDWRTVVLYDVEQRDFLQERLPTFPTGPVWREDGTLGIIIDTMPRSLREQNPPLHSEMGQWSAHKPGEPVSRAVALETIPQEVALSSEKFGPEIIGVFGGRTYSRISTPLTNVPFVMDSDGQLIGNVGPNRVPEDVAMHSQWLAIQLQADMVDVIDIIDLDTSETWTFDPLEHGLPAGALRNLAFQGGELTVVYVPPLGVPQRYSIDPGARAAHVVGSEAELPEDVRVEILHFPGPDGPLPMKLISNGSRPSGLPGPVLMSVYGGFQIDTSDGGLSPVEQLFVEQGGTVAVPALRGGMESLQGLGGQPEDTIIDAVAAASALIEQGRARPGADIVISGSSNGAYTAALAGLERPDLWAGVISIAGPHDLLSFEQYSFGPGWRSEYGTASEASDAHGSVPALPMGQPHFSNFQRERPPIIGRSPYHRALTATDTPAMLIITGGRDSRVDRSHSNKFAAAAQAIEAGRGPVLFASLPTAGHSFVGADDRLRLDQLIFGFAADATNLEQP